MLIVFGTLLSDLGFVKVTEAQQAKILLHLVNNENSPNTFELKLGVLKEIPQMRQPIQVIAAVS